MLPAPPPALHGPGMARKKQQQQQRAPQGGSGGSGRIPNLFWRSYHHEALRREERYVALPEEAELVGHGSLR